MSYSWYRQPRTYSIDGTPTLGSEQFASVPIITYNTDTYLRNSSPFYTVPSGPCTVRWFSELKSVDSNGNDIQRVLTRELRLRKTGNGSTATHEKWDNRWNGGSWIPLQGMDYDIGPGRPETTSAQTNSYMWLGAAPPPGTYRNYQTYYVENAQQGPTVEEGVFEVRGLAVTNVKAECPFDPREGPGTLSGDIHTLPSPTESYLFSGWTPTGAVQWEFLYLDNVSGSSPVSSPQSDGKVASFVASWNGKNDQGQVTIGLHELIPRAIANTNGGGNVLANGLGHTFLYNRDCSCDSKTGEVSFTVPIVVGGPIGTIYLTYQAFNACRSPNSFGYGWSSSGSAVLTETPSGLLYRDEGGRVETWTENSGVYTADRLDNYTLAESLGNPGAPYRLTFRDQTTRDFNADGKLVEEKDRNGNAMIYTYTVEGYLHTLSDRRGGLLTYDYGARTDGQPVSIRSGDPVTGRLVQFTYAGDRLASITDPAGKVTEFEYNADGRLITQTELRPSQGNRVIEHTYDDNSGRKRHSDFYGLWRETYAALPWFRYGYENDSETHISPIPEPGQPVLDSRSVYTAWDDMGRVTNIERNRIGLIF